MSVTKNKQTIYHDTDQDVKYRLDWFRIDNITDTSKLSIRGQLLGKVGSTPGIVAEEQAELRLADILDNCTATEKSKIKAAVGLIERELARKVVELSGETHTTADVFVI